MIVVIITGRLATLGIKAAAAGMAAPVVKPVVKGSNSERLRVGSFQGGRAGDFGYSNSDVFVFEDLKLVIGILK